MKKTTRPPNYMLLALTLLLIFFGITVLASASSVLSWNKYGNTYYFLFHQLIFGVLPGLLAMIVVSKIHYQTWQKMAGVLMLVSLALLGAVLIPGVGIEVGGASRWLNLGFTVFQPSELAKLVLIIYLATWFDKKQKNLNDFMTGYLPSLITVGMVAGLIYLQPDMGTLIVICLTAGAMFFTAGTKLRHLFATAACGLAALFIAIQSAPYRKDRLVTFLDPSHDPQGIGYHVNQALLAIGSGGLWGLGYNRSLQKYNYLPEPMGDSIFAVLAEEMGFIRTGLFVIAFTALIFTCLRIVRGAPDNFARLLGIGITAWIALQAFVNMAALLGLLPLTGIPLPFVSYGSSALITTLIGVGILLNISRFAKN